MRGKTGVFLLLVFLFIPVAAPADRIGGGDMTFSPQNALPVLFSHEKHVGEKGLKCSACHYQIFQMQKGSYKMDMMKLAKGEFCGKCHNGQRSFDLKDGKNCSRCHK